MRQGTVTVTSDSSKGCTFTFGNQGLEEAGWGQDQQVVDQNLNPDVETYFDLPFPPQKARWRPWQSFHRVGDRWLCPDWLPTRSFNQGSQQSNSRPFLVSAGRGFLPWEAESSLARVLAFSKVKAPGLQAGCPSNLQCDLG